ncbi:MAG TPA: arsenate reductase ArsC [Bryobacteraceae bacterium]|nr:arsenate reductase ArsC [Bryobacteraceae bacterium]
MRGERHRLLGPRGVRPAAQSTSGNPAASTAQGKAPPAATAPKKRVLFVCVGNSCRSQMAEAFARAYGADVLDVRSAGLVPALSIAPLTKHVLSEHNLSIDGQFPKGMDLAAREHYDTLVNMSGTPISLPGAQVLNWPVQDPIGRDESVYRSVANQIERLVMRLILEVRNEARNGA